VLPTSPTTSASQVRLLLWEGETTGAGASIAAPVLRALARRLAPAFMARVLAEDASIHAAVQRGLAASPHRGVLSAREERVHAFQRFVRDACRA
jgi:choline monooxygenase